MDKELKTLDIDWSTKNNILNFKAEYNKRRDILFIYSERDRPAVSIDCDGEYWVRVDPLNGEILGIEIEDFKRVFLKKHPEISKDDAAYVRPIADLIALEKCAT